MFATMEAALYPAVVKINTYLSSYILIFLLIAVGLWYSVKTNFVQIRCFGEGMKKVFGDLSLRGGKQASVDKVRAAVMSTGQEVLTYEGELIEAVYFSCSGGSTEDAVAVLLQKS